MNFLDLTGLSPLMAHTLGIPDVAIGLIDGPVAEGHPYLTPENFRSAGGKNFFCTDPDSIACRHGTFIATILNAKRSAAAPSLCPGCTLLLRPVFSEYEWSNGELPEATPVELSSAIRDCINEGARIVNLSLALEEPSPEGDRELIDTLDYAERKGVIVVAAAGNQGIIAGSALTRHPWVIPVVACDLLGMPMPYSNLTGSIAKKGLMAPGEKITSLGSDGQPEKFTGTSTAVPFVTGAIALLWSESPRLKAPEIKSAITRRPVRRRPVVPPLLNAWEAYQTIRGNMPGMKRFKRKAA